MCGRFTLRTPLRQLAEQFQFQSQLQLAPRYNVAPTQNVPVVRLSGGERTMSLMRWGLIPFWAKEKSIGGRLINARAESVAEKQSFRSALKQRRCLVLADGYYEWKKDGKEKQPYHIRTEDEQPFAMAGLWEARKGAREDRLEAPLETFTIITTKANSQTRAVHDRMPVILQPDDYAQWLDNELNDFQMLQTLMVPLVTDELVLVPVGKLVNNPRNDVAECLTARTDE